MLTANLAYCFPCYALRLIRCPGTTVISHVSELTILKLKFAGWRGVFMVDLVDLGFISGVKRFLGFAYGCYGTLPLARSQYCTCSNYAYT